MIYNIVIYFVLWGIAIASLFNEKVRKMWRGEREAFKILKQKVDPTAKYIWFHAASLGEFEQGRPLMERIRKEYPQYKILLTFYSPSGYEVRKNYEGADIICYMPVDTRLNAIRFLRLVRPVMAFFIKYEFWSNFLHILKHRNIPTYSVSSIFREDQMVVKSARKMKKVVATLPASMSEMAALTGSRSWMVQGWRPISATIQPDSEDRKSTRLNSSH